MVPIIAECHCLVYVALCVLLVLGVSTLVCGTLLLTDLMKKTSSFFPGRLIKHGVTKHYVQL